MPRNFRSSTVPEAVVFLLEEGRLRAARQELQNSSGQTFTNDEVETIVAAAANAGLDGVCPYCLKFMPTGDEDVSDRICDTCVSIRGLPARAVRNSLEDLAVIAQRDCLRAPGRHGLRSSEDCTWEHAVSLAKSRLLDELRHHGVEGTIDRGHLHFAAGSLGRRGVEHLLRNLNARREDGEDTVSYV